MSGGGGGTNGEREPELNCENIQFSVALNSPQEKAIEKIQVRMNLPVHERSGKVIATVPNSQEVVGTINWAHNNRLIQCMNAGTIYVATVKSIDDGLVKVQVRAAR
jgi:hypothetical protein